MLGQFPVNSQAHSPRDTAMLESAQVHLLPQDTAAHTHVQDWQHQSCLASCLQSLDKSKLNQACRICSLQVNFLIPDRYIWWHHSFFRQEYIFNPYFTSWLTRSKQLDDFLELNIFATNFILKLTTMLSKTFQNYFKNKTTTRANKKPNKDKRTTPSPKTKTCNTSCYYLSSSTICKRSGEMNISKEQ